MIKTLVVIFDGVELRVPDDPRFRFPHPTFKGFPSCCGAGKVGDFFVPELIGIPPIKISPACAIHDWTWMFWAKTADNFRQSNRMFLENMWRINDSNGGNVLCKFERMPILYGYYIMVSSPLGMMNFYTNDCILGA